MPLELEACWIIRVPPLKFQTQTYTPEVQGWAKRLNACLESRSAEYHHVDLWPLGQRHGWCFCPTRSRGAFARRSKPPGRKSLSEQREASKQRGVCLESSLPFFWNPSSPRARERLWAPARNGASTNHRAHILPASLAGQHGGSQPQWHSETLPSGGKPRGSPLSITASKSATKVPKGRPGSKGQTMIPIINAHLHRTNHT